MADFLTRLTERTFGSRPVTRPVIPSMFAQDLTLVDDVTPDSVESTQEVEEPDREVNDSEGIPAMLRRLAPERDPDSTVQAEPFQVDQSVEVAAESMASVSVETDERIGSPLHPDDVVNPSDAGQRYDDTPRRVPETTHFDVPEDELKISPVTLHATHPVEQSRRAVPISPTPSEDVAPHTSVPELLSSVGTVTEPTHSQREDEPVRTPRDEPPPASARNTVRPGPLEQIVPLETEQQPALSKNSVTAINVTIGRVEVKATTPTRPGQNVKQPAPRRITPERTSSVLTLDEYLKRRNEGLS